MILVDFSPHSKATMVKFGMRVQIWTPCRTPNFVLLKGIKLLPKIPKFDEFKKLKPTFL